MILAFFEIDFVHTIVHNIVMQYTGDDFEWDENKSNRNVKDRNLSFEEASAIWHRPNDLVIRQDPRLYIDKATGEEEIRFIAFGLLANSTLLAVVFTQRPPKLRIISARRANKRERKFYEKIQRSER